MEDEAMDPEAPSVRRSKRTRAQRGAAVNNPGDQSPSREERDESSDDHEEIIPRSKRNRAAEGTSAPADQKLIEVIRGSGKQISRVVKHWVERYEMNPKPAMVELLLMLFEACGSKCQFGENFVDEADVDDVVVALVTSAKKVDVEDCQGTKRKEFKHFKENLLSFWDSLVTECQHGPLFDQVLFEKCMDYVIALSCTPPRIYRQVASMVGLQLVTSFIAVAKMLGAQRETTQRQLNAEKRKRAEGPRVDSLNKRLSITHEKITFIDGMIRKIFTGLFVHRYRDVDPSIRTSCIESLGVWILSYPSMFLQDLYLKYLGWTLNDKSAGVRKASILALQNLYEVDDIVLSLNLFTERFANRMIELADDIDVSVAVCAIGLVKQLLRHGFLQDNDLGPLYDLLIDDPPEIRRAIGALVYDHLIAQKLNSSQSHVKDDSSDPSEVHLGRMLQILREFSADPILSAYVIDDIWEYMPAMKDWKCIISILLDENPLIELTDKDSTNLIRLLAASVKKAVGERIVPATDSRKQIHTKAQKEMIEKNRKDITLAMIKNYPQLLSKFMADKTKIPSLVEIIVHMNLRLYSEMQEEQRFKAVLQSIREAFFKHGEKDALRSCVKAIIYCSTNSEAELRDFSENNLKELVDELIAKLMSAIKDIMNGADEYSLLVNSKRLYELQLSRSVPMENVYEQIVIILQNFRNLDDEVVGFLLLNMYLHVAWCIYSVVNSKTVSEASILSLLSKRNTLFEQLEYYIHTPAEEYEEVKYGNTIACRVSTTLAEVWSLFKKENFASTRLERLGYCPALSIVQNFWKLCVRQLNISDDMEDEDANKEYVEELNRDAVMIAAAKLVASDVVPKDYLGPEIISHFVMHGPSVAEIVKHLISVLKKKGDDVSRIFSEALRRAYQRQTMQLSKSKDESLKSLLECKELAARLSGTFAGAARNKHRSDILHIVKHGVDYAFTDAPKQLSFLEVAVLPFISKLPTPDILDVLKDVQRRMENVKTDEDPSGWKPCFLFVETLQEKYAKNEGLQDEKERNTARRRGRPRKQPNIQGRKLFDVQSSSEEDSISGSDHDAPDDEENAPLIHSFRTASKLRSLRVSRDGNQSHTRNSKESASAANNLTGSKTGVSTGAS